MSIKNIPFDRQCVNLIDEILERPIGNGRVRYQPAEPVCEPNIDQPESMIQHDPVHHSIQQPESSQKLLTENDQPSISSFEQPQQEAKSPVRDSYLAHRN